jgi:hypothetical protein
MVELTLFVKVSPPIRMTFKVSFWEVPMLRSQVVKILLQTGLRPALLHSHLKAAFQTAVEFTFTTLSHSRLRNALL